DLWSTRSMAATGMSLSAVSWAGSCGAGGSAASEATDYRDDYPEHDGLVAVDDVVSGVARFELDVAVAAPEHLHGGLAVDHGGDEIAGVGLPAAGGPRRGHRRRSRRRSSSHRARA